MNDDVKTIDVFDRTWWYVVRHFDTDDEAKKSFDYAHGEAAKLKGEAQIAGYRLLDALPPEGEPKVVVVLGQIEKHVRAAADNLAGVPLAMRKSHVYSLVMRRIRFLANAAELEAPDGVYRWSHREGMRLDEHGNPIPVDEGEPE